MVRHFNILAALLQVISYDGAKYMRKHTIVKVFIPEKRGLNEIYDVML